MNARSVTEVGLTGPRAERCAERQTEHRDEEEDPEQEPPEHPPGGTGTDFVLVGDSPELAVLAADDRSGRVGLDDQVLGEVADLVER